MEIQNLLNSIYNIKSESNSDLLSKLKVGDILKAKVLSMVGDSIMLEVNGRLTLEAKDMSTIHYNIGDIVEFAVTDKADGKLFIKSNISNLDLLGSKLSELGIKLDENNKELIELLFKNQMPITKENISTILSTKNYYGKLVQFVKDNNLPINSEILNSDIKEALKNLIQNNSGNFEEKTPSFNSDNKVNISFPFGNEFLNSEGKVSLEKLVFMLKNNLDLNAKDIILADNLLEGKNTITNQIENLIKLLDEDTLSREGNIKDPMGDTVNRDGNVKDPMGTTTNRDVTAKDIMSSVINKDSDLKGLLNATDNREGNLKDLMNPDNSRGDNVRDLTSPTEDIPSKDIKNKLLSLLQKFDISTIKEKEKIQLAMKELLEGLEEIRNNTLDNKAPTVINRHVEELKASFDFVNKLNENIAFIQIPLQLNNSQKNLDIYIKKDSKKGKTINANNAKIFISLNTNNLDLVQVFIELDKKDINLNFKICNKKIKNIIKSNENILRDSLRECDFNNVIIKYSLQSDRTNVTSMDLRDNENKLNTLDMRV